MAGMKKKKHWSLLSDEMCEFNTKFQKLKFHPVRFDRYFRPADGLKDGAVNKLHVCRGRKQTTKS